MFYIFKIFVLNLHQKPFPDCLYNKGIAPTDARKWHLGKANTLLGKALEEVGKIIALNTTDSQREKNSNHIETERTFRSAIGQTADK